MTVVYVLARLDPSAGMVIDGVFSTKERAAAACRPDMGHQFVEFEIDRDMTDEDEFCVFNAANPDGVIV